MTYAVPVRNLVLMALMLAAAALAIAIKPTERVGAPAARINLESIIPKSFGDWKLDQRYSPIMPPPELEEKIEATYDETIARTYVDKQGNFVMLSIAYGGDQTGRLRVHRPESCYSAQGFSVDKIAEVAIQTPSATIPVKRLAANSGSRHEPITYWIRVGNETVTSLMGQRLTQLRFGLTGEIPDGLIFRVSTIDRDNKRAYAVHDRFIADLLQALPKEQQTLLVGAPGRAP